MPDILNVSSQNRIVSEFTSKKPSHLRSTMILQQQTSQLKIFEEKLKAKSGIWLSSIIIYHTITLKIKINWKVAKIIAGTSSFDLLPTSQPHHSWNFRVLSFHCPCQLNSQNEAKMIYYVTSCIKSHTILPLLY